MPAVSEKQRRFMALVHAVQTGKAKGKKVGSKVKKAAKSMTRGESRDFMKTAAEALRIITSEAYLAGYTGRMRFRC